MDARGLEAAETIPASRKLGRPQAQELADAAKRVVVAKGKKVSDFSPGGKAAAEVVDAMLGPTGNLRAPTLRQGKTVVVGFNEEAYQDVFG